MFIILILTLWQPVDSPAQSYTAKTIYAQHSPLELETERVEVVDPSGQVLWSRDIGAPAASFILAHGAGLLIVQRAPEASKVELQFINPEGQLVVAHSIQDFVGPVEISDNLEMMLVRSAGKTLLFSKEGQIAAAYPGIFSHLAIDAVGSRVALASSEGITIYSNQDELASIKLDNPYVRDMVFSPSGTRLAALTPASLLLWDRNGGKQLIDLSSYAASPKKLCFDDHGERVLVIMRDSIQYHMLTVDLQDLSVDRSTRALGSPDETVIEVKPDSQGWLIHLTPGWFRFSQEAG